MIIDAEEYLSAHIDVEPEYLRSLRRRTHVERLYPRMCTDHHQGRMLAMLTTMIAPRRIIELGTFTGYSALCMAQAMPEGAHIDTIEIDTDYTETLAETLANGPRGGDITLHTGDAEALLPGLLAAHSYDMAFIDANKRRYCEYYRLLVEAMPSGAYILADNTLWGDKVFDTNAHDPQTDGIRSFNDLVAADPRVSKLIIPVRDGLTVIRKL